MIIIPQNKILNILIAVQRQTIFIFKTIMKCKEYMHTKVTLKSFGDILQIYITNIPN